MISRTHRVPCGTFLSTHANKCLVAPLHKPLKGVPENSLYDIIKLPYRDLFQIVLRSNGMVMFSTCTKTIAIETLEGMLS